MFDPAFAKADVIVPVHVLVLRQPRNHCFECKRRRVLYRIGLFTPAGPTTPTEARCGPCWGFALTPANDTSRVSADEQTTDGR